MLFLFALLATLSTGTLNRPHITATAIASETRCYPMGVDSWYCIADDGTETISRTPAK
ncbi:MAG: hypothetical protein NVS1B6_17990 [Steroidobacteraceae bacterium]